MTLKPLHCRLCLETSRSMHLTVNSLGAQVPQLFMVTRVLSQVT